MEATPRGARIELNNFSWHHPGRPEPVISGLNLTINPGEKVLLLGTSGAGKSTLLHAIAGVLHDDDGESAGGTITLNGQDPAEARGTAGMMQQDPESSIVMATVGNDVAFGPENLRVPREEIWGRVTEALTAVGLNDLPLDHPSSALSGGQKQRLGLAGILSMHPGAMILDEPTANLDPSGVQEVRDSILAAAQATGATLLVVEHRVSIWAPHMDRIIVLGEGGTITHDGAPDTVLTEARRELIDAGVWVPNYVPRAPQTGNIAGGENEGGEALLRAENLSITRAQPTPKQRRARRRTIKRLGDTPAPAPTDLPVLRSGINLTLHAGEHLSVLGPNGAGKSTLALTLAGLLTAPNGTLTATDALRNYDGNHGGNHGGERAHWDVPTWTPAQMLSRIGYVFQEPEYQFIRGTVREELELGPRRLAALTREPLNEDDLAARTNELAAHLRLNHLLDANPFTLSGGEKRRLSVASALATAPRILILDEPTFGQDARTWAELVDLIRELLAGGTAVISITHDEDYTAALGGNHITFEATTTPGKENA
ncbi:ABC transporter ATP-binding protein [Rothia mucilaginosa]|jgi:ABC-type cobalt transport system, ATPase component|uniref:ABC transporter ATP-binding protein n=1 Tax=Rothia mucilaginosa TaxID=43675 RepID=UPI001CACDFC1|nr:ABC transporter ATP-binding protein [Rothia mucilaginosa]MBF1641795.1 ATP-binding cassette domain-containing protein [Rothia mucilaginosa]UQF82754.1 MAG: ATP-binding cassette domain-containing protein [Rothia mucilaginosa]